MRRSVLPATRKYVEAVAETLAARVRTTPAGAASLGHILVIVPTAESARRLRLALARHFPRGCVPPAVRTPGSLLTDDESGVNVVSPVRELAELAKLLAALRPEDCPALFPRLPEPRTEDWCVATAAQLVELWRILGTNALSFADVATRVPDLIRGETADTEIARWRDLAALEARFNGALKSLNLTPRTQAMKAALAAPTLPQGVEDIFLACADEAMPALAKVAWPVEPTELAIAEAGPPALATTDIFPHGTAGEEAQRIARYFADVAPSDALPALCLADPEMFPELHGALEASGLSAHDPTRQPVATSSLGHLVAQMLALLRGADYEVFSAFVRGGDVQRWLRGALALDESRVIAAITALDELQTDHLPETLADVARFATDDLKAIVSLIASRLATTTPLVTCRDWLAEIFQDRILEDGATGDQEFAAAAQTVNDLLAEFAALPDLGHLALPLFARLFAQAVYSLDTDEGDAICTEGWLELPFLDADEIVITGFQEGVVPESVVGHPFLPDALRAALGLESNERRAARDARILAQLCAARPAHAVKVFFHAVNAAGDVLKPSRLLFLTDDDAILAARAKAFYRDKAGAPVGVAPDLPDSWRLALPIPPPRRPLDHISPTSLGEYLTCPFTYYLKELFGEPVDDRAEELDPARFGTLCHEALERWSRSDRRNSESPAEIADELARAVDAILTEWFGVDAPAIVALQGESAKGRLAHFATIQAQRHAEGWRTVATERGLRVRYGQTTVRGRCDRVDYNPVTGQWCVIDYKAFDTLEKAAWCETGAKAVAYQTEVRGLKPFTVPGPSNRSKPAVWKSVQLPLYCAMLDASRDPDLAAARLENISSRYCVLGKTASETAFTEPMAGAFVTDAEAVVRQLIDDIERGLFWPPSPADAWQWNFSSLIFNSPAESVSPAWIADQEARR